MAEASLVIGKNWGGWCSEECASVSHSGHTEGLGGRVAGSEECSSVLHLASAHSSQRV